MADAAAGDGAERLLKLATRSSVGVSIVLVAAKALAWIATGSVSVFASLLDSVMDTLASAINLFAVDYSLKPADPHHRFGHGKAEALAGLGQAVFIAISACFLLYHALDRLVDPRPVEHVESALWVIGLAVVLTGALVGFQRHVIRRTGSTAVRADSLHFVSDLFTNIATIAALLLTQAGFLRADSLFGLVIGVFILSSAARVGWSSVRILMDEELPEDERRQIIKCAQDSEGVIEVRQLRSWRSGQRRVIHLDVAFAGGRALAEIHRDAERVAARLVAELPGADVSIRPVPDDQ